MDAPNIATPAEEDRLGMFGASAAASVKTFSFAC